MIHKQRNTSLKFIFLDILQENTFLTENTVALLANGVNISPKFSYSRFLLVKSVSRGSDEFSYWALII